MQHRNIVLIWQQDKEYYHIITSIFVSQIMMILWLTQQNFLIKSQDTELNVNKYVCLLQS